jgi:hypothetical protein
VGDDTSSIEAPGLPPSPTEPGSRLVTSGFFDQFPRFYESSETATHPGRLNLRHQAMIGDNLDIFEGAKVLDIASHDGRWSFAALQAGRGLGRRVRGTSGARRRREQDLRVLRRRPRALPLRRR